MRLEVQVQVQVVDLPCQDITAEVCGEGARG